MSLIPLEKHFYRFCFNLGGDLGTIMLSPLAESPPITPHHHHPSFLKLARVIFLPTGNSRKLLCWIWQ